jgi:hypothetical protein
MGFINSLLAGGCKSMNYYNKKMRVNDEVDKNLYTINWLIFGTPDFLLFIIKPQCRKIRLVFSFSF